MKIGRKYFAAFAALTTAACLTIGGVEAVVQYQEQVAHTGEVQRAEARVVATRIEAYLDKVAMQLREVAELPWAQGLLDENDRRREMRRLLKLNPAILDLRFVSPTGNDRSFVSRFAPDRSSDSPSWPLATAYFAVQRPPQWYGPVHFQDGSTPYVSLAVKSSQTSDVLVAELNLQYVTDLIETIHVGRNGSAYLIDQKNRLIAHPNPSLVHRDLDLSHLVQVANIRDRNNLIAGLTLTTRSVEGSFESLSSAAVMDSTGWLVFVEQPLEEVMTPVRLSIYRTVALLGVLILAGLFASRLVGTRFTRPIIELERGASRIAAGDLSARVVAGFEDEVASLAAEFNRMAENVQRGHHELEEKVQSRTAELAEAATKMRAQADEVASLNEQLQAHLADLASKKDEAERSNNAKTRFLAAASHDLRQPMQAVSLLVEVLHSRVTDPEASSLVDKIQASVLALETLFISLLDISRLDAGAVRPNIQEFRVASLLRLIEANFLPQAIAKGLRMTVVSSDAVVRSDPALLERVLGNLVSNAIRYTTRGRIIVACRRRGSRMLILVIDTGPGIPERFHQDIFEEFFQLTNPEHDRTKGLGLGLSIVRRTAEILQHPLILKSEVGRGSTFGIDVPVVSTAITPSFRSRFSVPDTRRFANTFVLVVDDDKESRFALEALCRQWGCHVVAANSARGALANLSEHLRIPDLVVSDFRLQDQETGLDVVETIRSATEETIPAIIVTGDTSLSASELADYPRLALLFKPINAEMLWHAFGKLLTVATLKS